MNLEKLSKASPSPYPHPYLTSDNSGRPYSHSGGREALKQHPGGQGKEGKQKGLTKTGPSFLKNAGEHSVYLNPAWCRPWHAFSTRICLTG